MPMYLKTQRWGRYTKQVLGNICGNMFSPATILSVCLSINKIIVFLGDTVVYKPRMATVIIEANDDPNGIFLLESTGKALEEGKTNDFL